MESNGLEFNKVDGGYEVAGLGKCKDKDIVIPSEYGGGPVVGIGKGAFSKRRSLKSVIIPDSVNYIGTRAFYGCKGFTSVSIPDSVTTIGSYSFGWCLELKSLTLGGWLKVIGDRAFKGCMSLSNVVIPNAVTLIDYGAFCNCYALRRVTIGRKVEEISNGKRNRYGEILEEPAFNCCFRLIEICNLSALKVVAGSLDNGFLAYYALKVFANESESLKFVETDDGFEFAVCDDTYHLIGYHGSEADLVLPHSVNGKSYDIYAGAFMFLEFLTSVSIPDEIALIGDCAFQCCNSIKSVKIGSGIKKMGVGVFHNCVGLEEIYFNATEICDLRKGSEVFFNAGFSGEGVSVIIGKNVTKIPAYIFSQFGYSRFNRYYPKITNVYFEEGSECGSIGAYAFYECRNLEKIKLPEKLFLIDVYAFGDCVGLISADIPGGVKAIGTGAFSCCEQLTGVELPKDLKLIHDYTFNGCKSLINVEIPNRVGQIGKSAFAMCSNLIRVSIPQGVWMICESAFSGCVNLTDIVIPEGAIVRRWAFEGCDSLASKRREDWDKRPVANPDSNSNTEHGNLIHKFPESDNNDGFNNGTISIFDCEDTLEDFDMDNLDDVKFTIFDDDEEMDDEEFNIFKDDLEWDDKKDDDK